MDVLSLALESFRKDLYPFLFSDDDSDDVEVGDCHACESLHKLLGQCDHFRSNRHF